MNFTKNTRANAGKNVDRGRIRHQNFRINKFSKKKNCFFRKNFEILPELKFYLKIGVWKCII